MSKQRLLLSHRWALGDTVLLTALVRDIHRAYPGVYDVDVITSFKPVWANNPYITRFDDTHPRPRPIEISWGDGIRWNGYVKTPQGPRMKHILAWYHYDFCRQTGLTVPVTEPKPDLHLTEQEQAPLIEGRYWVVMAGGKLDLTNKHWASRRYQDVVYCLNDYGLQLVQCGATYSTHVHKPLDGCLNMLGKTDDIRDLFNVIRHAEGVIGPVTGAMHIAAAFDKPCVVIAGGREEPWFEAYVDNFQAFDSEQPVRVPHHFLHTIGKLYCCDKQGCWKKRTVAITADDLGKDAGKLCKEPVRTDPEQAIARCMDMIQVDHVVEAVMRYYEEKVLPPIGEPSGKYPVKVTAVPGPIPNVDLNSPPPPPPSIRVPTKDIVEAKLPPPRQMPVQLRDGAIPPLPLRPPTPMPEISLTGVRGVNYSVLDNHVIGGKYTICVLCWGPHTDLAKRCLDSILSYVPRERIDLRIACNECAPETLSYVKSLSPEVLYTSDENRKKYPTMRDMFWDPHRPITTKYVLWFDDDTTVVDPSWIVKLSEVITANHPHGARLYGAKMHHDLMPYARNGHRPESWFYESDWWKGVQLRVRGQERAAPNGSCIDFVAGWFWALATESIRSCNIPDTRLYHNGGDITIGAQVLQHGFKIKEFNRDKSIVTTPVKASGGRRVGGYEESFPWVGPDDTFQREFRG